MKKLKNILYAGFLTLSSCTASVYTVSLPLGYYLPYVNKNAQKEVVAASNNFNFTLARELANELGKGDNFVFSAFSAWLPLVSLSYIANDEDLNNLLEALYLNDIYLEDINYSVLNILYKLYNTNVVNIANKILVDDKVTINNDFANLFERYFIGEISNTDLQNEQIVEIINDFIYKQTDGVIENFVTEPFGEGDIVVLLNTVYFMDEWLNTYFVREKGNFYSPSGIREIYFIRNNLNMENHAFFENEYLSAIRLPYESNSNMYIILPSEGDVIDFFTNMDLLKFSYIQNNMEYSDGFFKMPRFTIESEIDNLREVLETLGLPFLDCRLGGLENIIYEESNLPIYISGARQKAVIEVDEYGTTAAAVTMNVATFTSLPMNFFEMIVDRPFMFILESEGVILFSGFVNEP